MLREFAALIEMAFLRPLKPCRRKVPWRRAAYQKFGYAVSTGATQRGHKLV